MSRIDRYTCEQVFRLFGDYLDKELTPAEIKAVQAHLAICEICTAECQFEAETIRALRERLQRLSVSEALRSRLSDALKRAEEEFRQ